MDFKEDTSVYKKISSLKDIESTCDALPDYLW